MIFQMRKIHVENFLQILLFNQQVFTYLFDWVCCIEIKSMMAPDASENVYFQHTPIFHRELGRSIDIDRKTY
jgi:hypothetical protein